MLDKIWQTVKEIWYNEICLFEYAVSVSTEWLLLVTSFS